MITTEIIPITDRAQWLAMRKQDVTASTIGCLLGVHEYMTAYQLYALKCGLIEEDPEETAAMKRGRLLEPVALQLLAEERPDLSVTPATAYYRDPLARIGATPDAFAMDDAGVRGIVQIKTTDSMIFRKKWKDADTGEIAPPLWIVCQALLEAHLTDAEWACVAVLVVGMGLELHVIDIPLRPKLIERMRVEASLFWQRIALQDPPPLDYGRDGAVLAQVYAGDDGDRIDLSDKPRALEIILTRKALKEQIKAASAEVEAAETEIKAMLGNAASAIIAPNVSVSWKLQKRAGFTVAPTEFRQFRVSEKGL